MNDDSRGPATLIKRRAVRRKPTPYACPVCGYDIRMTPHGCPECGTKLRWGMIEYGRRK